MRTERGGPHICPGQVFAVCPSEAKVGPSSDKRVPAKKRKTRGDFSGPQRYWEASTALCVFCLHAQLGRTHSQGLPTDLCTWVGDTRVHIHWSLDTAVGTLTSSCLPSSLGRERVGGPRGGCLEPKAQTGTRAWPRSPQQECSWISAILVAS